VRYAKPGEPTLRRQNPRRQKPARLLATNPRQRLHATSCTLSAI